MDATDKPASAPDAKVPAYSWYALSVLVRRGAQLDARSEAALSPRDTDLTALVRRAVSEPDDELAWIDLAGGEG
mgnify:CR=1 FL=1